MQKFQTKLKELWEKIKGFFQKLNKKTRILLGVCLVVILRKSYCHHALPRQLLP